MDRLVDDCLTANWRLVGGCLAATCWLRTGWQFTCARDMPAWVLGRSPRASTPFQDLERALILREATVNGGSRVGRSAW